jgi:hypothetical protein
MAIISAAQPRMALPGLYPVHRFPYSFCKSIREKEIHMKRFLAVCCCMMIVLSACGSNAEPTLSLDDQVGTAAAATREFVGNAATIAAQTVLAWEIAHYTPTPTVTSTPVPTIGGLALNNTNCRTGPASTFPSLVLLNQGQSAEVIGQNTVATPWYQVALENGDQCWVVTDNLALSGETYNLPEIQSPPTPEPPATLWAGKWSVWSCYSGEQANSINTTLTMTGPTSITFSYTIGNEVFQVFLNLIQEGAYANGTIIPSSTWTSEIHLRLDPNHNQFRGIYHYQTSPEYEHCFCGARNGYGRPSPCQ